MRESYSAAAFWRPRSESHGLLTGMRPFAPDTKEEAAVLNRPPVAPRLVNPRVPGPLSEVCMRLLEKEAERRYASADELVRVLEGLLAAGGADWDEALLEAPTVEEGRPDQGGRARASEQRGRSGRMACLALHEALQAATIGHGMPCSGYSRTLRAGGVRLNHGRVEAAVRASHLPAPGA